MFRFGAPQWLPALALVPALAAVLWIAALRRRAALRLFADSELVSVLTRTVSRGARRLKEVLVVAATGLIVLSLARPQFGTRVETVRSVGQDVLVAVDLSESMLAEDVVPSRLERSRLAILRLMEQLDGDRIGLVAFAADAFVQSPLTIDYAAAALFLDAMHPDLMPTQGTNLGAALRVSLDAFEESPRDARVLLLVTDGEDHEGEIEPQLQRAVDSGVRVHTVGVGSPDGVPIPRFDERGEPAGFLRDEEGSVVTTRLDETTLRRIAEATGGRYVRAGAGGSAFAELVDEIAATEGEELDARQITDFEEQYQIFLALALLLLVGEALISDRRRAEEAWLGRFET